MVVIITNATAAPAPIRRFFANATVLFCFPSGLNSGRWNENDPGEGPIKLFLTDLYKAPGGVIDTGGFSMKAV